MPTQLAPTSNDVVYSPQGAQRLAWRAGQRIVVYSGRTRIGKTTMWCWRAQTLCLKYPGCRILFLRETRHSLSESVLVTFEDEILIRADLKNPDGARSHRQSYEYKNGSAIVLGGMDDPDKYLSGEYDHIYIFQAEQCSRDMVMRVNGRCVHFVTPFQQLGLDVNPREANHWIKVMCDRGEARMITGTLEDNPKFYDGQAWTKEGIAILETDKFYSESDYQRLALGKWCSPEGARFKNASRQKQGFDLYTTFPQGIPGEWAKWIGADWGYSDPYCALWFTRSPEGKYYVYREDYERGYEAHEQVLRIVDRSAINERYEGIWLDASMEMTGKFAASFGADEVRGSAVAQYKKELDKHAGRFGSIHKAYRQKHERDFITLSALLDSGDLLIERGCTHTWDEIEGAVIYKDPRTGLTFNDQINPHRKLCPDHSLSVLCYGLVNRTPMTSQPEGPPPTVDQILEARERHRAQVMAEREDEGELPGWAQKRDNSGWLGVD